METAVKDRVKERGRKTRRAEESTLRAAGQTMEARKELRSRTSGDGSDSPTGKENGTCEGKMDSTWKQHNKLLPVLPRMKKASEMLTGGRTITHTGLMRRWKRGKQGYKGRATPWQEQRGKTTDH